MADDPFADRGPLRPRPAPEPKLKAALAECEAVSIGDGTQCTSMVRFNQGKSRLGLVPASLSRYAAAALAYGAIKYSANNWRKGGSWVSGYESLQRHLDAFREGEDIDAESGLPHLALASFGIMMLIEFYDKEIGTDDRFRYADQPIGQQRPGRILEFREPPRSK